MVEDLDDFFEDRGQWEGPSGSDMDLPPRPPRSRREMRRNRKSRKRRNLLKVLLSALLAIALILGVSYLVSRIHRQGPIIGSSRDVADDYPGPGETPIEFSVDTGQSAQQIGANLEKAGIVASQRAFVQSVNGQQLADKLFPGTFELKTRMKASDVVAILTDPSKAGGFLEVRSGDRARDVIARAARLSGVGQGDFDAIVSSGGRGILPSEAGGHFEGWFEPGRYDVKKLGSADKILRSMVERRTAKLDLLGVPEGEDRQRILNVASITEAEVNKAEYYAKVVRVIDNRLGRGMPLGMDSTVAYSNNVTALKLTNAMLQNSQDPYNTRIRKGLPPTPIGSAGDDAIQAAMNPESGDWLYFVTVNMDTGETRFSTDKAQFDEDVKLYKQWESNHRG